MVMKTIPIPKKFHFLFQILNFYNSNLILMDLNILLKNLKLPFDALAMQMQLVYHVLEVIIMKENGTEIYNLRDKFTII